VLTLSFILFIRYKGEIGFFDFYIIPLAKKLKDCGVFGVSSDEYLNYAIRNREEWSRKGEAVTAEMVAKARDVDMARMERQASIRGPVIAEMKSAVRTMRTPPMKHNMFKQPSFRHLRATLQSEGNESQTAIPSNGFSRQRPSLLLRKSVSIGTAERKALSPIRGIRPTGSAQGPRRSSSSKDEDSSNNLEREISPQSATGELAEAFDESLAAIGQPGIAAAMKKPQRKPSMAH